MSIQAVAWALDQDVGDPAAKLVLISLANAFNQQRGRCFPTVQQIARDASLSERSVIRKIRQLVELGMVRVEASFDQNGRQTSNEYLLPGFGQPAGAPGGGCQPDGVGRVSACHPGEGDSSVRGEGDTAVREEGDSCVTPLKEPEETPEEGTGRSTSPRARARKARPVAANDDTPLAALIRVLDEDRARAVIEHRKNCRGKLTAYGARLLARKFEACADPNAAADMMIENGWQGFEPAWMDRRTQQRAQPAGRPAANRPSIDATRAALQRVAAEFAAKEGEAT